MARTVSQKVVAKVWTRNLAMALLVAAVGVAGAGCGEDTSGPGSQTAGQGGKADGASCVSDADCPQVYCLPGGPCPFFGCLDGQCVDLTKLAKEGETCGGFSPEPRRCALGLRCEVDENGPTDAPGVCVREGSGCQIDADCPQPYCVPGGPCPSFVCVEGECVDDSELAKEGETCGGFGPEPRRCAPGLRCEVPEVTQGPTDGPGVCVSDEVDTSCRSDDECPQPYCLPGGPCPHFVCVDGACVNENDLPRPEPEDCRTTGCDEGEYCTYCWIGYACIPEGALC